MEVVPDYGAEQERDGSKREGTLSSDLSERYGLILEAYLKQGGVSTTQLLDCNNVVQMLLHISLQAAL